MGTISTRALPVRTAEILEASSVRAEELGAAVGMEEEVGERWMVVKASRKADDKREEIVFWARVARRASWGEEEVEVEDWAQRVVAVVGREADEAIVVGLETGREARSFQAAEGLEKNLGSINPARASDGLLASAAGTVSFASLPQNCCWLLNASTPLSLDS
jgi:hypothetical protein